MELVVGLGHHGLRVAQADLADAPAAVAHADDLAAVDGDVLAAGADPARVTAELGHAGDVRDEARAEAALRARFEDGGAAAFEQQVGGDAVFVVRHDDAQRLERLDHLDADRADLDVHALHV